MVKALCLGASAVGLGRPFLYAQSGFGQPGAERSVEIMRDEIERCMRFLGVGSLSELGPELVEVLPKVFVSGGAGVGVGAGAGAAEGTREEREEL